MNSQEFYAFALKFAGEHAFLTWCFLWLLWGPVGFLFALINLFTVALSRFYRVVMVTARGWPPVHLDADGDWKPEQKVKEEPKSTDNSKL